MMALVMDPAIERIYDPRRCVPYLHGLRQIAKSIEKAAHRGLGRHATAFRAANSVGNGRHHIPARLWQFRTENGTSEILVVFTRPSL
jgi:hypothetical protein